MDQVQELLLKLKQEYLAELPERLDRLESIVLNLETHGYSGELYNELYRQVHSLKGSGGTHGVNIITSVCHPLEDFLAANRNLLESNFTNIILSYLDVLRLVVSRSTSKPDAVFDVENLLADLRERSFQPKYCALLVENSGTVIKLISRIMQQSNVRVVVEDDGYVALGRCLSEPFDLLISGQEVKQLNGMALIAAAKLACSGHHKMKTILLTANPNLQTTLAKPDFVLNKDDQLSQRLPVVIKKIIQGWEA